MDLQEAKTVIEKAIDERVNKYEEQSKMSAKGIEESLKGQLDNLLAKHSEISEQVKALGKQQDAIELATKRNNQVSEQKTKSFFNDLAEQAESAKEEIERIKNRKSRGISFDVSGGQELMYAKAVGSVTSANVTGTLPTMFGQNITSTPNRKQHVRGLIPSVPLTDAIYSFPRYTNGEGSVGIQTEGSAKAQTDADIAYVTATPVVIAHFQRHSEQILQDIPRLLAFTSGRMVEQLLDKEDDEILNGAGGSNRLNGIITQATAYAPTGSANTSSADRFSYLLNAISQLAQSNYTPNGILVNPYAYYELMQIKTTTKEYTMPYAGVTFVDGTLRIAGVPVYQTTACATNAFTVGDWTQAELLVRNAIQVDISREDSDNFQKNLVTVRVEERVGLAVYQPGAFITGSWTALAS
jgi:HK97 family phage major capsid protein